MTARLSFALFYAGALALGPVSLTPAWAEGKKAVSPEKTAPAPAAKVVNPQRTPAVPAGDGALDRFARMTPEEREQALTNLPPARRAAMIKRLQEFQKMPVAERARATTELERLRSLPPQRQNQVRKSLQQFQTLADDRKTLVGLELERLGALAEEERRSRMNSEEFRNRYSPVEQQMMGNLAEVLPRNEF